MTTPTDHMTIAEIIHDFATRSGNLTDRRAREDLAAILERRMVAERAGVLREAADEMWRIFLRLPHTPSPLGDYLQRRVNYLRERAVDWEAS